MDNWIEQLWIEQLNSGDRALQCNVAIFAGLQFEDKAYPILPLMIEKAREVDVYNGQIDLHSSNFVGYTTRTTARLIKRRGFSRTDEFHREVLDWIFSLNYCTELNVAAHSVHALGELWIPPESVRQRLIELVHDERCQDNQPHNSIRGLAYQMLSRLDRTIARNLIDTAARHDFQNAINHRLEEYRIKYPHNDNVPRDLQAEIGWLSSENAG